MAHFYSAVWSQLFGAYWSSFTPVLTQIAWARLKDWWLSTVESTDVEDLTRTQCAYHEAGHAVAILVFKEWKITRLSCVPEGENQGCCLYDPNENLALEQRAIIFLAGPLGELLSGKIFGPGIFDDWYTVTTAAKWIADDTENWNVDESPERLEELTRPVFLHILQLTEELVSRHKVAIETIALELLRDGEMAPARVKELFDQANFFPVPA